MSVGELAIGIDVTKASQMVSWSICQHAYIHVHTFSWEVFWVRNQLPNLLHQNLCSTGIVILRELKSPHSALF
jgi:hypothetical protein